MTRYWTRTMRDVHFRAVTWRSPGRSSALTRVRCRCARSLHTDNRMRPTAVLLALLFTAGPSSVAVAQTPAQEVSGTLHVIWGDPPNGPPVFRYVLSGDAGVTRLVDIDASMIAAAGGLMQVNGTRMRVQLAVAPTPQGVERARSLLPLTSVVNPGIVAESQALSAQVQLAVT